jgi:hypothetical protein
MARVLNGVIGFAQGAVGALSSTGRTINQTIDTTFGANLQPDSAVNEEVNYKDYIKYLDIEDIQPEDLIDIVKSKINLTISTGTPSAASSTSLPPPPPSSSTNITYTRVRSILPVQMDYVKVTEVEKVPLDYLDLSKFLSKYVIQEISIEIDGVIDDKFDLYLKLISLYVTSDTRISFVFNIKIVNDELSVRNRINIFSMVKSLKIENLNVTGDTERFFKYITNKINTIELVQFKTINPLNAEHLYNLKNCATILCKNTLLDFSKITGVSNTTLTDLDLTGSVIESNKLTAMSFISKFSNLKTLTISSIFHIVDVYTILQKNVNLQTLTLNLNIGTIGNGQNYFFNPPLSQPLDINNIVNIVNSIATNLECFVLNIKVESNQTTFVANTYKQFITFINALLNSQIKRLTIDSSKIITTLAILDESRNSLNGTNSDVDILCASILGNETIEHLNINSFLKFCPSISSKLKINPVVTHLYLENNELTDNFVSNGLNLTNLQVLNLNNNKKITNCIDLSKSSNLKELYMNTALLQVLPYANTSAQELQQQGIPPLKQLYKLQILHIKETNNEVLETLSSINNIYEIHIRNTCETYRSSNGDCGRNDINYDFDKSSYSLISFLVCGADDGDYECKYEEYVYPKQYLNLNKIYTYFNILNKPDVITVSDLFHIKKNIFQNGNIDKPGVFGITQKISRFDTRNSGSTFDSVALNYQKICDYLNENNVKSKYQRFLNQTLKKVSYKYVGNGLYEDDAGQWWWYNGDNNVPIRKYNPNATLQKLGSKIYNKIIDAGKEYPNYIIKDQAEVNRALGIITFDNETDTKIAQQNMADKTSISGTISSQKDKFRVEKERLLLDTIGSAANATLLIPNLAVNSYVDYHWTKYKDYN